MKTKVDLARTLLYLFKSTCRGCRFRDGKWGSGGPLFPAGHLDQFRILDPFALRQLCFSKGEGKAIVEGVFRRTVG